MITRRSSTDPIPVYYKLQLEIKKQIEEGRWKADDCIPTERELSEKYSLSAGTVKKSLLNLVNEGYLYRIQGKGTFVAGTVLRRESLRYYRLQNDFPDKEINLNVELIELKKIKDHPLARKNLQLAQGQELYEVKRCFSSKHKPIVFCTSYLPTKLFPALEKLTSEFSGELTFYKLLEQEYGVTTISNNQLISTSLADETVSTHLNIPVGNPLLFIEMISHTYKNKPYEYRESFCLTSEQKLNVFI